jgi:hypothetical protein
MYDDDDCGAPTWVELAGRVSRARTHHECSGCVEPIEPGQVYTRTVGLVDGELWMDKHHHPDCPRWIAEAIADHERQSREDEEDYQRDVKRAAEMGYPS